MVPRLRIGLIADIHCGPRTRHDGKLRKLGDRAIALVDAFVADMNDRVRPDLVVQLGDVIEDTSDVTDPKRYAHVIDRLGRLDCGVLHLVGNHDERRISVDRLHEIQGRDALRAPLVVNGVRILSLASHSDDDAAWVDPAAVSQLSSQLQAATGPTLLFVHHALADQDLTGNPWFEGRSELCLIAQRREIRGLLSHTPVLAAVNGHAHWNDLTLHEGRPYFTIHSLTENVGSDDEPVASEAWAVLDVWDDRLDLTVRGNAPAAWSHAR